MNISNLVTALLGCGSVAAIVNAVIYRRRNRADARKDEATADVEAATVPDKVRSSSNVTLEAELAALTKTFRDDRTNKEETIAYQAQQITEMRAEHKAQLGDLREQVAGRLNDMQSRLDELERRDVANAHWKQVALDYIAALREWIGRGSKNPPPPVPRELQEDLNRR